MPQFQAAANEYAGGRYLRAASLVEALEKTGGLDAAGRAFCERQREICLRKAANPAPVSAPAGPPRIPTKPAFGVFGTPARSPAEADCGPRALRIAAEAMGIHVSVERLRKLAGTTANGTTMEGLAEAARAIGLKAEGVKLDRQALADLDTPAVAWTNANHFVAVLEVEGDPADGTATIHDPNRPEAQRVPQALLFAESGGYLLKLRR
jgi:hypothetical protein